MATPASGSFQWLSIGHGYFFLASLIKPILIYYPYEDYQKSLLEPLLNFMLYGYIRRNILKITVNDVYFDDHKTQKKYQIF